MPLSAPEAFKAGFLARCVEGGLGGVAIAGRVKEALAKTAFLGGLAGQAVDFGKWTAQNAIGWGLPAAVAAPLVGGAVLGGGLAKATDIDDTDVADVKDREVLEEYRRQTERLRRQRAARDYAQRRRQSGGHYFM